MEAEKPSRAAKQTNMLNIMTHTHEASTPKTEKNGKVCTNFQSLILALTNKTLKVN